MIVQKKSNLHGRFFADGDKSITIRAILFACLSKKWVTIDNPLIAGDTLSALDCAKALGAQVKEEKNSIKLRCERLKDNAILDCGNSGTTARLLIGMLSGALVNATITGDNSLKTRPMDRVINPLILRGAKIESENLKLPVKIHPQKLLPFEYLMEVDSAQVKSALLLSGLTSKERTKVTEKNKTRDHTEKMMSYFGCDISVKNKEIVLEKSNPKFKNIHVPCDPSSAYYYLALGLLLGSVTVPNVLLTDSRVGFLKILKRAGGKFTVENRVVTECFLKGDITSFKSELDYFEVEKEELPGAIDELVLLAVMGAKNKGCAIHGASELRVKESDRLNGICQLIKNAGGNCNISGDDLIVEGGLRGKYFEYSSDDHRMTMTAFVLMASGEGGNLKNEESAFVSFPNFYKNYYNLQMGLIGKDVSKSPSNVIHNFVLRRIYKKSFCYECLSLEKENFDEFLNKCPYKAFNATVPYKNDTFERVSDASESAKKCRATNFLIAKENGDFYGYNTDGMGLVLFLKSKNIELKNKNVLIAGAGGAGKSIAFSLIEEGANVYIKNRTMEKAQDLCNLSGGKIKIYNGESCEILINATTLKDESPFLSEEISLCRLGIDINYRENLAFLNKLKEDKKEFYNGFGMLFYQAYLCDKIITNQTPDAGEALKIFTEYCEFYHIEQ